MDILGYIGIKGLGVTDRLCERYGLAQVKIKSGIKFAAIFSPDCAKILGLDGTSMWYGDYDPSLGLFGQKAVIPKQPAVIVATEFEALQLAANGGNAVSMSSKDVDSLSLGVLADSLAGVTTELWVWQESLSNSRNAILEKFLLYLSGDSRFTIRLLEDSTTPPSQLDPMDITKILNGIKVTWRPKGILTTPEIFSQESFKKPVIGVQTGYAAIDKANGGIRQGEITLFTAGTGVGKSTIVREIAYHVGTVEGKKCGMLFLEEPPERTSKCLAAIRYSKPVDLIREQPETLTDKQWAAYQNDPSIRQNFIFYNHFGSMASDELFSKIDYLIDHEKCDFIFLDHISIVVSGMSSKEGERKDIDILMTNLATRAVAKNVGFVIISHLSVPEGKAHEEGGRVNLSQLRGSGSIKQLCWSILAIERNQQDPDTPFSLLRQLKNREKGITGPIGVLRYDITTGRLVETDQWGPREFEKMLWEKTSGSSNGGKRNSFKKTNDYPQSFIDTY